MTFMMPFPKQQYKTVQPAINQSPFRLIRQDFWFICHQDQPLLLRMENYFSAVKLWIIITATTSAASCSYNRWRHRIHWLSTVNKFRCIVPFEIKKDR